MAESTFLDILKSMSPRIEEALKRYAWPAASSPEKLRDAMNHSLLGGGKRLRPALVLIAAEACGGSEEDALPVAAAFELVHTYSLIHDDLPAMDDDDLRRGIPTCHKVYGEATAILAGDAMLTYAFGLLASHAPTPEQGVALVRLLADAAGLEGMVGGQQLDLDAEGAEGMTQEDLVRIHERKTGRLIAASAAAGGIVAGADQATVEKLHEFGMVSGLAFQVTDDILDITASAEELGKSPGKDAAANKLTYPALLGLDGAREEARALANRAAQIAGEFERGDKLVALAEFFVCRAN